MVIGRDGARVRRIRGQVEAIERALDGEAGCEQVMHRIAGARGTSGSEHSP